MAKVLSIRIGTKHVKICELQYGNNGSVFVSRILKAKLPEGAVNDGFITDFFTAENFLQNIINENKMTATDVIFSISSTKIATKEIEAPIIKENKLIEMIDANASEYFPIYLEDYILAHSVLDKGNPKKGINKQKVLVLAAPKELIDDYFQLAERLKLNVKSIDYAGNSAYQMIRRQIGPEPSVVVQIQEETTTVNILVENVLKLQRTIPYGKSLPVHELAMMKHIDEDEAATLLETETFIHESFDGDPVTESLKHLINNVIRVIDYYNSRNSDEPVEKVFLVGESVSLSGIDFLFANEFEVSVAQINRFHGVKLETENELLHKIVTKYVGCLGSGIAPVNFMPKEKLEKIKNVNTFRLLKFGVLGAAVAGVLLCAIPLTQLVIAKSDKSDIERRIAELEEINGIVDDYYTSYDKYMEMKEYKQQTEGPNDSIYELIKALESNQSSDIALSTISFTQDGAVILGTTSTKETLAKYIIELEKLAIIRGVFINGMGEVKDEEGVITNTFTMAVVFEKIPDFTDFAEMYMTTLDYKEFVKEMDKSDDAMSEIRKVYDKEIEKIKEKMKIKEDKDKDASKGDKPNKKASKKSSKTEE